MVLRQAPVLPKPGSRVIRPISARSRVMSKASSPSEPSTTGNSIVRPSNVKVAVRVIASVLLFNGLPSQGPWRDYTVTLYALKRRAWSADPTHAPVDALGAGDVCPGSGHR